jgi:phytoene dehydrogenase-like protein
MLNLKQKRGFIRPMECTETKTGGLIPVSSALQPMEDRSRFRVCVVGGGIAGLSTCVELFRLCDREGIDVDVVLVEGKSRLGGRVHTDSHSLSLDDMEPVQIELGASWIHGIDNNPIMSLACEAGITFVNANEHVQMLQSGMVEVNPEVDDKAGELFDDLIDTAVRCTIYKPWH